MFIGNHLPELVVLLIVALVVFGPKRLPEIGSAMGKGIREFKKGTSGDDDGAADRGIRDADTRATLSSEHRDVDIARESTPVRDRDAS